MNTTTTTTTTTATARPEVLVLGRDRVGIVAEGYGMRYYLTDCCLASAKGCDGYTGCRSCYAEIDSALGGLPDQDVRWSKADGLTFVPKPLTLTEVFGDGIPYSRFACSYFGCPCTTSASPVAEHRRAAVDR